MPKPQTIEAEAEELTLTPPTAAPREAGQQEAGIQAMVDRQAQNVAPAAPVAAQGQSGLVAMIERVALTPDVDVAKLEKLLDMQERILDREAEQAFNRAMVAARGEMQPVVRDAPNKQTSSMYAKLESIIEAIEPIYTKHGFMMSFGTDDSPLEKYQRIVCDVSHTEGHTRHYHDDVPIDVAGIKGNVNKTPTHAHSSTLTYGRRNLTVLIWNIALKNGDDDGNAAGAGETITEEQATWISGVIEETDADLAKFCRFLKVGSVAEIPAAKYETAKKELEAHKAWKVKQAEGAS